MQLWLGLKDQSDMISVLGSDSFFYLYSVGFWFIMVSFHSQILKYLVGDCVAGKLSGQVSSFGICPG